MGFAGAHSHMLLLTVFNDVHLPPRLFGKKVYLVGLIKNLHSCPQKTKHLSPFLKIGSLHECFPQIRQLEALTNVFLKSGSVLTINTQVNIGLNYTCFIFTFFNLPLHVFKPMCNLAVFISATVAHRIIALLRTSIFYFMDIM